MNNTEMSIVRAAMTEKAAGEVAAEREEFCGSGLGREEALTERMILQQAERVAWKQHHRAANEATAQFLREMKVREHDEQEEPRKQK